MGDGVALVPVALDERAVLANLLELYAHDMSEAFPIEVGADGRFGYEALPWYWTEPGRRFPFFIKCEGQLIGFVLIVRDGGIHDVAEFFVLRRHRRGGIGRRAAAMIWDQFPGSWTVRVSEGNEGGMRFWRSVIGSRATETRRPGTPNAWRVFSFTSERTPQPVA